ncbi:kinase-like domain-containing protein [Haematococcus lacustris]
MNIRDVAVSRAHTLFVLDMSTSMRKEDVVQGGSEVKRCDAVLRAACGFLEQQIADRPGPRDTCSLITFNGEAGIVFQGQRVDESAIKLAKRAQRTQRGTNYADALARAAELIKTQRANLQCVVFLSDGGDNNPTDALLQSGIDGLITACKPGQLIFHALGLGPPGSTFVWLRKMAAAAEGKFHKDILAVGRLSSEALCAAFKSMSSDLSSTRSGDKSITSYSSITNSSSSSSSSSGSNISCSGTWPLCGELQTWDAASQGFVVDNAVSQQAAKAAPMVAHAELHDLHDGCSGIVAKGSQMQGSKNQEYQLQVNNALCLQAAKASIDSFNQLLSSKKAVSVKQAPKFLTCKLLCCGKGNNIKYLAIEPYLEGSYTKFNDNEGYVAALPDDAADREAHELAQAFSHWSWVHSGGRELLCDIQGVGARWTDPQVGAGGCLLLLHGNETAQAPAEDLVASLQVNSVATKYGRKDMGAKGIAAFFGSHRCNDFCRALGIDKKWLVD